MVEPTPDPVEAAAVEVVASLVASVVAVPVTVGAHVDAGDTLVVVESMKMEMPLVAPVAGVVRSLAVAPADVVEEGDIVAVIAPDGVAPRVR